MWTTLLLAVSGLTAAETVSKSVVIEKPLKPTFDVVTTAKYWTKWHPATLQVTGDIEKPVKTGNKLKETAKIAGFTAEGEWTVSERRRPTALLLRMPASRLGDLAIRYRFEKLNRNTTRFTRELTFDVSKLPPALADVVRRQMDRDSEQAVQNLKRFIESGS